MAKAKQLESVVSVALDALAECSDATETESRVALVEEMKLPDPVTVLLEVPVREMPDDQYRQRFIEVPGLSSVQANAAKSLFEGLHARQERLQNGRYVRNVPDAIRWVLEQIGEAK